MKNSLNSRKREKKSMVDVKDGGGRCKVPVDVRSLAHSKAVMTHQHTVVYKIRIMVTPIFNNMLYI